MKNPIKIIALLCIGALLWTACSKSDDSNPSVDLVVNAITPAVGEAGTVVTIDGQGFDEDIPLNNTVSFNGVTATVNNATATEIQVIVPDGTTTGPVSVSVDGITEQGPIFTYDERLKFVGEYENDDYDLRVFAFGILDTLLTVNTATEIRIKLVNNSEDEIEMDITDFLEEGFNSSLGVNNLRFAFEDDIIAQINDDEFEIEEFDFTITNVEAGVSVPARFEEGEGILEGNMLLFSFKYSYIENGERFEVSAEDIELEMQ